MNSRPSGRRRSSAKKFFVSAGTPTTSNRTKEREEDGRDDTKEDPLPHKLPTVKKVGTQPGTQLSLEETEGERLWQVVHKLIDHGE